jgi:hypothetical protein
MEARVQGWLEAVDNNPPEIIRRCDIQKLINSLDVRKACGCMGFQMNASGTFQEDLGISNTFDKSLHSADTLSDVLEGRKVITLPKPVKDPKFPQNLGPNSLLSTTGKLFEKVILK